MSITLILAAIILVFFVYHQFFKKKVNTPPGPWGLPFLGNILSMDMKKPHKSTQEFERIYGPIFTMKMGPMKMVALNEPELVREALNLPIVTGRPENKAINITTNGKHGLINSEGKEWQEQRRFALRNLRDFGFGRQSMDSLINEEVKELVERLKKEEGQPISLKRKFGLAVLNALWTITSGQRYNHDDENLIKMMDDGIQIMNEMMESGYIFFLPELAEAFPNFTGWNRILKIVGDEHEFFKKTIKEHEENPAPEDQPRDFIDIYLNEIKKTTDTESSFYGEAGRHSLLSVIGDLHRAGSGTTSTTLSWAILYLITHTEVQKKLQNEIDEIIGKNRIPCLADKPKMLYTEAVIMEVLRKSSMVPNGALHTAIADFEFHGYTIEKGAHVVGCAYNIHHNPKYFDEPEKFRPERFLTPDEKAIKRSDALIPFSVGKRACLGEPLARDVLFLFLTGIFQRFEVEANPADPMPSLEPYTGVILFPQEYKVVLKDRIVV